MTPRKAIQTQLAYNVEKYRFHETLRYIANKLKWDNITNHTRLTPTVRQSVNEWLQLRDVGSGIYLP